LAALLSRRPWWQGFSHVLLQRAYLPVGATAAVALAVVSVRYYSAGHGERNFEPVAVVSHAAHLQSIALAPRSAGAVDTRNTGDAPVAVRAVALLSERLPDGVADLTPWSAPRTEETPSARFIAASIAQLERSDPGLVDETIGGSVPSTSGRVQPSNGVPVVEFASVSTLASKRSRLLADLGNRRFTPEPQAPDIVRERLARRLGDTDFNDSFSRVALKDGGVSLKF
jgi:hypothetical protein